MLVAAILLLTSTSLCLSIKNTPKSSSFAAKISVVNKLLFPAFIALTGVPKISYAVKGAFELDAEYYFNALIGKSSKDISKIVSSEKVFVSPRKMNLEFVTEVSDCVLNAVESQCGIPQEEFLKKVKDTVPYSLKYFQLLAPIASETLDDQYYFDMILYLYYLEAGKILTKSEERVNLRRIVGDNILKIAQSKYAVLNPITPVTIDSTEHMLSIKSNNVVILCNGIKQILDLFSRTKVINGYTFDDENLTDLPYVKRSLSDGVPINFQIIVKNPATILSFIEQYKLDTFYHPEIIATTICSLARQFNYNLRVEDYLLDNVYRTENFNVQAQDILLEFNLVIPK